MGDRSRRIFQFASSRKRTIFFILVWLAGILTGTFFAVGNSRAYLPLMRIAPCSNVSIVWLLLSGIVPFSICALAAKRGMLWVLYTVCFLKAFLFSGGALLSFAAFGSAGWLLQPMLQFSRIVLTPVFCWFCIRCLESREVLLRDLVRCSFIALAVAFADHTVISPFLAILMV